MRRRKLLISIGALGAGGTAAFGTEAFTSVEAERSVDVTVADDQNAFLAIQPLQGNNANQYVTTESDNTIALNFDSESDASGSGVNQDAVTQVEDLFKIINQGTQEVSVFFEDDSDAVTFRVTRSTDTTTSGSSGQSLEGADKSVELGTGEQIAVGITIDTLNNDVSGSLIDNVTIQAKSEDSAPQQSIPEPQYVVTPDPGDSPNRFSDIPSALSQAEEGAVVGIEGSLTNTDIADDGTINVSTNDLTLTGFEGTPTVETGDNQLELAGDGVRLLNVDVTTNGGGGGAGGGPFRTIEAVGDNVTIDGVNVTAPSDNPATAPVIYAGKNDSNSGGGSGVTITNSDVRNAPISVKSSGSVTVTGNNVEGSPTEGIFSFGSAPGSGDYTVENNRIRDSGAGGNGQEQDIKFDTPPNSINGQSSEKDQLQSLLTENDISVAAVNSNQGTKVTEELISSSVSSSTFSGIQDAVGDASNGGVTVVESGSYNESFNVPWSNFRLIGLNDPVITGDGAGTDSGGIEAVINLRPGNTDTTIEGFTVRNPNGYYGIYVGSGSGSVNINKNEVIDNTVERIATDVSDFTVDGGPTSGGVAGIYVRGNHADSVTVEDNIIQEIDTTGDSNEKRNAVGISLKSFTDGTTADGASIRNNIVRNIKGSRRNKGISVNGDYKNPEVINNTINGLIGDNRADALKAITINQNKEDNDPDDDGTRDFIGPINFTVEKNEIRQVDGVPDNSFGIIVGNYEELDSNYTSGSFPEQSSEYKGVSGNNIIDTNVTGGIARFNLDETGVDPTQTDTLLIENNFYGRADGPSGQDANGSLSGSGAPVVTVGESDGNASRIEIDGGQSNFASSENSDAGSSL